MEPDLWFFTAATNLPCVISPDGCDNHHVEYLVQMASRASVHGPLGLAAVQWSDVGMWVGGNFQMCHNNNNAESQCC